jgi:hypothetical protein
MSQRVEQLKEFHHWTKLAQEQTGKSPVTQLKEILALRKMGGQCGISDYYNYKLYDDSYLKGRGREDFLGWKLHTQFSLALNPRSAVLPAWDKNVFTLIAGSAGLPVAPVMACFHPAAQISPILGQHLRSIEDVQKFLRNPDIYPLFGKPVYSQQSYGSASLTGYDDQCDSIVLVNGGKETIFEFSRRMVESVDTRYHKPECGYFFQKSLDLAPSLQAFTKWSAICGVRVVCLNGPQGVVPIQAMWKVAVAPNHVDNFSSGRRGNLIANVDLKTGEVSRMVDKYWPDTQVFESHPVTGVPLAGLRLPDWERVLEICHLGGALFPLMKIHHWDFALTAQGPLILELNDIGGIAQLFGGGLLTEYTREFLKCHANLQEHPWVKAL